MCILLVILLGGCRSPVRDPRGLEMLKRAPLYTFNEREVDVYLRWLSSDERDVMARVEHLARKNIGQTYRPFLLGEFPFELRDADPMYCLSASDCVTFVEQTYAMAAAHDWSSFFKTLQRIRYREGVVGFATRNHFIETDWNPNNEWLFEEITGRLADGMARPAQTRIDRPRLFAKFGLPCQEPPQIVSGCFVKTADIRKIAAELRDGDVVEIVKGDDLWQTVTHLGLVFHDSVGRVTILHSGRPAVHEERLQAYLDAHSDVLGIRFLRMRSQPK